MDFNDLTFDFHSSSININDDELKIYAHKNELLTQHIEKTLFFFHQLLDNDVLFNLYNALVDENYITLGFDEFKKCIDLSVFFHDIGKISFKFQLKKLNKNNPEVLHNQYEILSKNHLTPLINNFTDKHSFSSSLCFISKNKNRLTDNGLFILSLAYAINSHHTYLKDFYKENEFAYKQFDENEEISLFYLLYFLEIADISEIENMEYDHSFFQNTQKSIISKLNPKNSVVSFFYNYIYSLLITSDVLASREYNTPIEKIKGDYKNIIDDGLKSRMINSFLSVSYNSNIKNEHFSGDVSKINDINDLRKNMLLESSFNLKNNIGNHVFFLNMPTGGGKTNTSMKLALDLIENTDANRIIYAMPFINIIEQNYDVVKNTFSLDEKNEIRKIYSATETIFNDEDDEFKSKIILQDSFFNYPVIFTTFTTFFDGILRNNKRYKYKIASYINSVVILDEIQSLPLKNWNSLYYIINEIAEKYNIYFIIMSATLPRFDKLKLDYNNKYKHEKPFQLIENPEKYFNHYLFDRTEIKNDLKELNINNIEEIKKYLYEIIESNFNEGYNKGLIVLNTIKSSKIIYNLLSDMYPNLNIDLLNSSLLFNIKKEIIYKINNLEKDNSRYLLVSTQSVEAGVDVSFDFVIRDFAILDSIEQIRGRCNRNRELNCDNPNKKGNVYLIDLSDKKNSLHTYIYDENEMRSRIEETKNILNNSVNYSYNDIVNYYNNVSDNINLLEDEKQDNFIDNDRKNIVNWNLVHYSNLQDNDGIHIIDSNLNQFSVFIPAKLNIFTEPMDDLYNVEMSLKGIEKLYSEDKNKFIFSYNELEFLKQKQKESDYKFIENNFIDGGELIKFYKEYLSNSRNMNFDYYKIIRKEFSSVINKFIVNITINDKELVDKILDEDDGDFEKLSYFYIMDKELIGDDDYSLYSIKTGLNYNFVNVEIL